MQEEISFGLWLRKQRRVLDVSRQEFANQVGCAEVTLRRIEAGTLKPSKELANLLLEKLGTPESERSQWISFARGMSSFPSQPFPSLNKPKSNLPTPLTTFIGREKELTDVTRLIMKHRLVTLTGSGGVGKTRLSIIVGEQVLENYADGVWLVELAPILDPLLVPRTMAIVIGLRDEPQRPVIDMLSDYLQEKQMLIILDNCEHLLDTCAQLADTLLKRCPGLKILATSREVLGILGEATYRVPSLELPDLQQSLKDIRRYESARLFEERAQLARIDFSLTIENAPSVAKICSQLDGIPLAIELAAARISNFSTEQIIRKLQESFTLLTTGNRTALPRHQTLRAAIDWSYDLLSPAEKTVFRRLSVFVDGWTLDAAESICSDSSIEPEAILDLLIQLCNKSLVIVEGKQSGRRYRMLETIRQYAEEELSDGEEESTRDQHLKYFLKLSEQIEQELVGPQQTQWFALTHDESSNLLGALAHAVRTDVEAGLYISGRLELFWTNFESHEGMRWLAELLLKPESKAYPHARAKALNTQSRLLYNFERFHEAQVAAEESLALFRAVGDQYGEVDSLLSLGLLSNTKTLAEPAHQALVLAQTLGDITRQAAALHLLGWDRRDFKRTLAYWEEAIRLYRQVGHWGALAHCLGQLGLYLSMDGQPDAAQKHLDESKLLAEQLSTKWISDVRSGLGQIALVRGNYEQARAYFQQDAEISKELGNRVHHLWSTARLGFVELHEGNTTEAHQIFTETIRNFQKDGNQIGVVFSLEGMSSLYVAVGKPNVAVPLIGWCDATREEISDMRPKLEQADMDKINTACIARMGEVAYANAYDEGRKWTLDKAVLYALKV